MTRFQGSLGNRSTLDRQLTFGKSAIAVKQLTVDPLTLIRKQEAHEIGNVSRRPLFSA